MTYISIRDQIKACLNDGRIRRVMPVLDGLPEARVIYVCTDLYVEIFESWDTSVARRMAQLHADLDRFISGDLITVGGMHDKHAFMKPLDPQTDEVWEIRSTDPRPSYRVFGRFAEQDVFVATHMESRIYLDAPDSFEWVEAIRLCKAKWRTLFVNWPPVIGEEVNDYISEKVVDLRRIR